MTQFKDKTSKLTASNGTEYIPNGLFLYPVLMAADILLYDSNYVYVGQDQKQHVELTRNIAERFNNKFGQTFTLPEPLIPSNGNRIMDLLDPIHKMSKSAKNENGTIFLLDKPAVATKKIMGALTDNLNRVKYDYKTQPGITNLITIYSVCSNLSIKEIEDKYQVIENYGSFKKDLANIVSSFLIDFQAKYNESIKNIDNVLVQVKNNANKCLEITEKKLAEVYSKVGLIK
jgi:tryptophanyl-tRNA synthetase